MNLEKERELYNAWHFEHWKKNCASSDSFDDANKLYDRVYSHEHTMREYERGFMAWCASASREGYKMVPVEPTKEMFNAYGENSIAPVSMLSRSGYKAMIGAVE